MLRQNGAEKKTKQDDFALNTKLFWLFNYTPLGIHLFWW